MPTKHSNDNERSCLQIYDLQIFSPILDFLFTFLVLFFDAQKFSTVMKFNRTIFFFVTYALMFKKYLTNLRSFRFALMLSSKRFLVSKFRPLIHFELVFKCGIRV